MNFTFFSKAHGTFSRIDHILDHKSGLGKFKKIEIIPSIFSDHNAVGLDLNYRRKTIKNSNIWRLTNTLLNNQQITEEIKKEIKICIETNENENTTTQNLWDTVKAVLRGKFIAIQAHLKKQEKSQINNLTLHLKQLEKEEMKNPRVSRRKEILKIRAEINAKETKETIAKINKTKSAPIPRTLSTSPTSSNASRPGRSILFTKVKMGIERWRQTLKSLRVCASTPFAQSRHPSTTDINLQSSMRMTTVSAMAEMRTAVLN